jgi:hypothetical protein
VTDEIPGWREDLKTPRMARNREFLFHFRPCGNKASAWHTPQGASAHCPRIFASQSRGKAVAAAAPKRRFGAPRRREDYRTPKPRGNNGAAFVAPASWSAVVLYRFSAGSPPASRSSALQPAQIPRKHLRRTLSHVVVSDARENLGAVRGCALACATGTPGLF